MRSAGRMARNVWWSVTRGSQLPPSGGTSNPIPRGAAFFQYLACCPGAAVRVHEIVDRGERKGHLALSTAHGQTRIAGVWLDVPSAENLAAAYRLAQRLARRGGRAPEITAMGSSTTLSKNRA